jgi:hypothetical protein
MSFTIIAPTKEESCYRYKIDANGLIHKAYLTPLCHTMFSYHLWAWLSSHEYEKSRVGGGCTSQL